MSRRQEKENALHAVSGLRSLAGTVRLIEEQARHALFSEDDPDAYREKLREKTRLLMELPDTIEPLLSGISEDARVEIVAAANAFSDGAARAWELSSVFYMSALLYPEDYREGEKNDLESFIERFSKRFL